MSLINSTTTALVGDATDAHGALYKAVGVGLAVASGAFIGSSFVLKKKGLLQSTERSGGIAGEGYGYLKSSMWWSGMILSKGMKGESIDEDVVVGELCNFVAYAFTQAILVTPLGALSVVISAVLSSMFLKERLSFQGKIGCLQCILGAIVIVLHAPEQGAADNSIETFKKLMLSVGFLVYAALSVTVSLVLVFYCGPRWGKRNMLVYISVCSLIGSLSVVFTQGIGGAIVYSVSIKNQFTNWFVYLVLALTIITLVVEIVYLNKALNMFNTALVTPTYYVIFTTLTIVSSTVLYRGFDASGASIATCVLGFVIIVSGVALLHHSRSEPSDDTSSIGHNRRSSLLQMFDNEKLLASEEDLSSHDDNHHPQSCTREPGPTEVFAKPSLGFGRYTNTTRRSLNFSRNSKSEEAYTDNISMDSTMISTSKSQDIGLLDDRSIPQIPPPPSTPPSSSSSPKPRRTQESIDPLSAMRLGLNHDRDDKKGLIGEIDD
ncbi:hypothetical protein DFQ28_001830 [Apophysomyces sp. BC1034]|nr:hypothetical protein DFQ30_009573 [Apophysomyces sp. BC1015]KAG0183282.1 hypothetical protein DFQ29_007828 [Apophysomyces sp. BC1021]KAG0194029.1 hypothetical protein DFQ28_001830 [Apophysomyces sp. BC1034]